MKKNIIYLFVLGLLMACEGNITKIKIASAETDKKHKSYMLNYGARPDADFLERECPWIKDPKNTVFIYIPISFKLENKISCCRFFHFYSKQKIILIQDNSLDNCYKNKKKRIPTLNRNALFYLFYRNLLNLFFVNRIKCIDCFSV